MAFIKFTIVIIGTLLLLACNDSAPLRGGVAIQTNAYSSKSKSAAAPGADAEKPADLDYNFSLLAEGGADVIPQQISNAIPAVLNSADGNALAAKDLKG
ncbi:MAG: hypothetical protein H7249_14185 [Chitinophagaceae bacterium]|nr:hypothetical protein [Oligoflexus sp.]